MPSICNVGLLLVTCGGRFFRYTCKGVLLGILSMLLNHVNDIESPEATILAVVPLCEDCALDAMYVKLTLYKPNKKLVCELQCKLVEIQICMTFSDQAMVTGTEDKRQLAIYTICVAVLIMVYIS